VINAKAVIKTNAVNVRIPLSFFYAILSYPHHKEDGIAVNRFSLNPERGQGWGGGVEFTSPSESGNQ